MAGTSRPFVLRGQAAHNRALVGTLPESLTSPPGGGPAGVAAWGSSLPGALSSEHAVRTHLRAQAPGC